MAGQAGVVVPDILAGPILQRVTPKSAVVWMVTSTSLDAKKVRAEVWDPLPEGVQGFISEPTAAAPVVGQINQPADVELRKMAPRVWVYRIRITANGAGWPANRALAYRIGPHGTDWLVATNGVEPLPGDRAAAPQSPGRTLEFPWFCIDSTERQWAVLSLPGQSPSTWIEAETYLNRLCRGSARPAANAANPRGPNVPSGRPTTALFFDADAVPQDQEMLERIKWEIGRNFAAPDFGESFLSKCLAVSPELWDFSVSLPPSGVAAVANPPAHPLTRPSIAALTRIAAHVPLYGLPKNLFQITGFVQRLVANRAFASCYLWGNQNESLGNDELPEVTEQTSYSTGEVPSVQVLFQLPTEIRHPEERAGTNRVFPFLLVATPTPVLPNPQPPGFRAPDLGAIDNLFALSVDNFSYLNVPDRQIDDKASMTTHQRETFAAQDWALTGRPAHRVYQLAIASDASNAPPRSRRAGNERNWNARNLSYVDGAAAPMLQAVPAFSVLSSESKQDLGVNWPGRRLSFFSDASHGRTVVLMRVGHRVIPQATADVFLGNRFRLIANQTDGNQLGGIRVMIDGQQRAITEPNGRAPGLQAFLSVQPDGTHALSIAGQGITLNQLPGPGTARPPGRNRIWRERTFQIVTKGGQIIQVDDEPVVAQGVRILLDPVYMRWAVGFSVGAGGAINHRAGNVQMVIIHRTDVNDSVATADARVQPGGRPFFSQYFLARDGTLIKGADENEIMNHAPGRWQTAPGNILFTNASGVGVEISKLDNGNWYSEPQYETLLWLLGEYVNANPPVDPLNIVGHSDVQQEGRDDPGLSFEWARLEAAGFGIIRDPQAALLAPLPAWPTQQVDVTRAANQEIRLPTATFLQSINQDVNAFQNLFQNELAQPHPDVAVRQRVRTLLEEIGYHQTGVDVDHPQPPHTDFTTENLAFRSHFFAGARRIYFAFLPQKIGQPLGDDNKRVVREDELARPLLENNPVNMRDLTAVWALRVRDHVVAQRQAANPPRPARRPTPPAAR